MPQLPAPFLFRGKSWISVVSAIVFGYFAVFSLIMGPLFLTGALKSADGRSTTYAGVALSIFGVAFSLITALAIFRAKALTRPMVRICREGIVVRLIGTSSLDGLPEIPFFDDILVLLRLGWLIVSLQGFKQQLVYAPWKSFRDVQVWGLPMQRKLTVFALFIRPVNSSAATQPGRVFDHIEFQEAAFAASLDEVARDHDLLRRRECSPIVVELEELKHSGTAIFQWNVITFRARGRGFRRITERHVTGCTPPLEIKQRATAYGDTASLTHGRPLPRCNQKGPQARLTRAAFFLMTGNWGRLGFMIQRKANQSHVNRELPDGRLSAGRALVVRTAGYERDVRTTVLCTAPMYYGPMLQTPAWQHGRL